MGESNGFDAHPRAAEDNDKTQQEIADLLCIKQTTYSKYELGRVAIPIDALMTLADFTGYPWIILRGVPMKKENKSQRSSKRKTLAFCFKS